MANLCSVRCQFDVVDVDSAVLLVLRKRDGQYRIVSVINGQILEDNKPYFGFTFVVNNFMKPMRVRILGMNNKKKVISCITRRLRSP